MDSRRIERAFWRYFHREIDQASPSAVHLGDNILTDGSDSDEGLRCEGAPSAAAGAPAEKAPSHADSGGIEIVKSTGGAAASAAPAGDGTKSCTILVAHGNVIRWMALRALCVLLASRRRCVADSLNRRARRQLNEEAWLRLIVPHASITTLLITPAGDVLLAGLGDAGHLEAWQVT